MMDEMAIRQHIQYDSSNGISYGSVDLGNGMPNDSLDSWYSLRMLCTYGCICK